MKLSTLSIFCVTAIASIAASSFGEVKPIEKQPEDADASPRISFTASFVEISDSAARILAEKNPFFSKTIGQDPSPEILSAENSAPIQKFLGLKIGKIFAFDTEEPVSSLANSGRLKLLSQPGLTTNARSGERVASFMMPLQYGNKTFDHKGCSIDGTATLAADGSTIDLNITLEVSELVGFEHKGADGVSRPVHQVFAWNRGPARYDLPEIEAKPGESVEPIFSTRKIKPSLKMKVGQVAVFTGLRYRGGPGEGAQQIEGRDFLVFVTPKILPPEPKEVALNAKADGNAEQKPVAKRPKVEAPPMDLKALPAFGKPVPGKPGYVTSPFAPDAGYVDLRGFASGTEVRCPYTNRVFLTP